MMATIAVLDDDLLADITVTPAFMPAAVAMTLTGLDLHLHVLRERRGRESRSRKRQRGNGGSRECKFPHLLLLQEAGSVPADTGGQRPNSRLVPC